MVQLSVRGRWQYNNYQPSFQRPQTVNGLTKLIYAVE